MKNKIFKNMEWSILICSILLCIIGCVALYSATQNNDFEYFKKQIIWFVMGIFTMVITMIVDYKVWIKLSPFFYGTSIILLIAVLFTKSINGASSWFNLGFGSIQPAEISKISIILFTTYVITIMQQKQKEDINIFWRLLIVLLTVGLPIVLIILQPDFGTAIAYIFALAAMLFVSGINKEYIIVAVLVVAVTLPIAYLYILPEHAKKRIDVFLNPESDPKGSGYNVLQSKIAIGAGELTGMGILNGNQTQLGYLSPKTTDFIYSVIGEEMGFIIAGTVILIYVTLITKSLYVAKTAKDDIGAYIATGISGVFLFHMTENIGMTMGLLPITGVPLLFVSYGGSSMITSFICIGLLLNVSGNRNKTIFIK